MTASDSSPVPIVVAGCGAITKFFYASALTYLESRGEVKLAALCDPNDSNREGIHSRFPHAKSLARLEDAPLGDGTLVVVASPPNFHAKQTIYALSQGCAVLCEKPMAANLPDAESMVEAAEKYQRPLAIGLYRRFFRGAQMIKDLVVNQNLGRVLSFDIEEGGPFSWEAASDSFFRREVTPGGVLYDAGVHVLDLLLWWFDEPAELEYSDDAAGGLEANCDLRLQYKDFTGKVRLSRDWKTKNTFRINFEKGSVAWQPSEAGRITVQMDGVGDVVRGDLLPEQDNGFTLTSANEAEHSPQAFIRQMLNLTATVRTGAPVHVSASEGLRSLKLIEACYNSRKPMKLPWLTEAEAAGLYQLQTQGAGA